MVFFIKVGGNSMKVEEWTQFSTFDGDKYDPSIQWWTLNPNLPARVLVDKSEQIIVSVN